MSIDEREAFLTEPRVAVLSVAASDDHRPPLTTPLFYSYEPGGDLMFFTGTQGRKARKRRLIERAGMLSLNVQRDEFPFKHVTVEGTVIRTDEPPSEDQMFAIVRRYMPEEAAREFVRAELEHPNSQLILYTVRPERWLTMDMSDGD